MQAFAGWWSTIQWAEFAVGAVIAAIITGGLGFMAHIYDKKAALRIQSIEHRHELDLSKTVRQHEIDILRQEKLETERWAIIAVAHDFEGDARRLADLVTTLIKTSRRLDAAAVNATRISLVQTVYECNEEINALYEQMCAKTLMLEIRCDELGVEARKLVALLISIRGEEHGRSIDEAFEADLNKAVARFHSSVQRYKEARVS